MIGPGPRDFSVAARPRKVDEVVEQRGNRLTGDEIFDSGTNHAPKQCT